MNTNQKWIPALSVLADALKSNVRPGHPDYISKAAAAERIERIISEMAAEPAPAAPPAPPPERITTKAYEARTRHGWGWHVRGPIGFTSMPISSAAGAEAFAEAMNAGRGSVAAAEAARKAGAYFGE